MTMKHIEDLQFEKFMQLPAELRCLVYQQYFGSWSVLVRYDADADRFQLDGIPDRSLLLASKSIKEESQPIFEGLFTGKLELKDVRVHRKGKFGFQSSLEVVATMGIDQMLTRVRTIIVENGTTGMLVLLPWYKFTQLERIELEESLKVNPFAIGKISQHWPFESSHDRDGKCCFQGVFGYDQWTCVPSCIAKGHVRVVSVKRGYASGACLKAVVEHKADRGEFLERICEDETGAWKWIMSCGGL